MRTGLLWLLAAALALLLGLAVVSLLPPSEAGALAAASRPPRLPLYALGLLFVGGGALGLGFARRTPVGGWQPLLLGVLALVPLVVSYGTVVVADGMANPTSHNLWPFEFLVLTGPGLVAAVGGSYSGWGLARLLAMRKRA